MAASLALAPLVYHRREPERTALYRCVQRHLDGVIAHAESGGRPVPSFVSDELAGFLRCGILAYGFARAHCSGCGYDRLVAFSCKGRGFCPSCCGRRMSDTAAALVDAVLPDVPVRQWVLSLPKPVRFLLAYDAPLCSQVLGLFLDAVFGHLRRVAKAELGLRTIKVAHPGAITVVQRFGSAADLNIHFHSLVPDGVFVVETPGAAPVFRALPAPTPAEIAAVSWQVCERTVALLRKLGKWVDADTGDTAEADDGFLAHCAQASLSGSLVFAAGARPMRLHGAAPSTELAQQKSGYGFDVHAWTRVPAGDRERLERLCRYILRPPIANDRLRELPDGRYQLRLKRPWSDGTTHLVFAGVEFLARLAALVPPPRVHLVRYHGVFAPHAKLREAVVPEPEPASSCGEGSHPGPATSRDAENKRQRRLSWAKLMARVFELDVLQCPRCQSRMQVIAFITRPDAIRAILQSIGLATAPPQRVRASLPEQAELDLGDGDWE